MAFEKGTLFILSGPSGVGKGTLKDRLLREFPETTAYSVSATTRSPRAGEIPGRDYFFMSREAFEAQRAENGFLENAEYAGNLYGTPRAWVEQILRDGKDVILEIEVQGAMQVMQNADSCISVFIMPPSMEELERRLRSRGTEDESRIEKRLSAAKKEISMSDQYDYRIVNDELDEAYARLREIYLKHAGFCEKENRH